MKNNNTHIEIFSEDLNGWIVLNFQQFDELLQKENLFQNENEFDFSYFEKNKMKLKFSSSEQDLEKDLNLITRNVFRGDYVEVKEIRKLRISFDNNNDNKLNVKILNQDYDHDLYHNIYTIWMRAKVLMKSPDEKDFYIKTEILGNDSEIQKIKIENIRLLTDHLEMEKLDIDYKLKHFNSDDITNKLFHNKNDEKVTKSNKLNLSKIYEEIIQKYQNENIFYNLENQENLIIISPETDLIFITNLILIKSREQIKIKEIENNIQNHKEKEENLNKIIEMSNKFVIKFPLIFKNSIITKIIETLSKKENFSYIIQEEKEKDSEKFTVIIYGIENLEKITNYLIQLEENSVEVVERLSDWLNLDKNSDELDVIAEKSQIIDYKINKDRISFFGEETSNKNFKKLMQIHLKYGEKFLKAQEENETIKQKINSLSSEISSNLSITGAVTGMKKKK